MSESAKERAARSSGVTTEMIEVAEKVLGQFGVGQMTKKYSNRDVLYEVIRATLVIVAGTTEGVMVRDEEGWTQYFEKCMVIVRDPDIGKQLLKIGTESTEAFGAIIETIAQNRGLVVPLGVYPGINLFKGKRLKQKGKESPAEGEDE